MLEANAGIMVLSQFCGSVAAKPLWIALFQKQTVIKKKTGLLSLCLQVKCINQPFLKFRTRRRKLNIWIFVLEGGRGVQQSTLSRYKILDFVLLTSPYPLPLCFYPSPPAPPPLLITAVSKKLQEKQLPQREKQYELLIYRISGLYIEKQHACGSVRGSAGPCTLSQMHTKPITSPTKQIQ